MPLNEVPVLYAMGYLGDIFPKIPTTDHLGLATLADLPFAEAEWAGHRAE
jgi:hypothetical protein